MSAQHRIFCALDTPSLEKATALVSSLAPYVAGVKVGLEFTMAQGVQGVKALVALGVPLFLDLKFHDIPNTVAGAVREAAKLGVSYLTVHTSGGLPMLKAAVITAQEGAARAGTVPPKILGVTMLTSLAEQDVQNVGFTGNIEENVRRLAGLAAEAGLAGVVASPLEAAMIRREYGQELLIVTPGIRASFDALGDQARTKTPAEALKNGADYLVVGRPITQSKNPLAALLKINKEITDATD